MYQAVLPVRSAYSVRSFPLWNKWQTAAFQFLPVFRLSIDALCLPHYSSFSQFVETTSPDAISHIWRASMIALVGRRKCFDDLHLLAPFVRFRLRKLFYSTTHLSVTFSVLLLFVYLNTTVYRCPKVLAATSPLRSRPSVPLDKNLMRPPPE